LTKGKHGNRAENRARAQEDALAPYKRRVVALNEELARVRQARATEVKALRLELKRARVERNEGIGPALAVAQREAATMRDQRDSARAQQAETIRKHERFMVAVLTQFADRGMTDAEAYQLLMDMIGENIIVVPSEVHQGSITSNEMAERLVAATRRSRRSPNQMLKDPVVPKAVRGLG
jgi:hypothetical protein